MYIYSSDDRIRWADRVPKLMGLIDLMFNELLVGLRKAEVLRKAPDGRLCHHVRVHFNTPPKLFGH